MSRDSGPNVFQRGVMALILLSLLRREDMYGYQLVQETERRSSGRLKTQEGSLYPVLYRLQEQGLISDHRVLVGKRMTRVYYHLEPAGEARLEEMGRPEPGFQVCVPGFGAVGLRLAAQSRQQLLFVFSGTGQIAADGPDISVDLPLSFPHGGTSSRMMAVTPVIMDSYSRIISSSRASPAGSRW